MPEKHRFKLGKLIRDGIPDIMRADGFEVTLRSIKPTELIELLKGKLLEETNEVIGAKTQDEIIEELSDVLEVVQALAQAHTTTFEQIERRRLAKKNARGGFEKGTFCEGVEVNADNPKLGYCRAKFTEIKS